MTEENKSRFFSGGGSALETVQTALREAGIIRIATAYFEPSGWYCLQDCLKGRKIRLLLGRSETSDDKIAEVVDEFFQSLASGVIEDRSAVIEQIRKAVRNGEFLMAVSQNDTSAKTTTLNPRYIYHHAKLYIADYRAAVVTSANFTFSGLMQSREAGITVSDADDVRFFADRFDYYFDRAKPVADLLLQRIDEWLKIYRPYEIYMLSLLCLYGLHSDEKPGKLPQLAGYQRPVVSRVIRNINEFGGAMLVASTGLGKTIMAAHVVANLRAQNRIFSAIVMCPAGLKAMWQRTMRAARVSSAEFSYYVLSVDDWKKVRDVTILEREMRHADGETIIILDESHHLRNSDEGDDLRLRHRRIQHMVGREAKVLLMTATPYSKDVRDINSQLLLLPHSGKIETIFGEHEKETWRIEKTTELPDLKCGVVLTAPCVVKNFSTMDEHGYRYVLFSGGEKRYFPGRIHIRNIEYVNQSDEHLASLLKGNLLYVKEAKTDTTQGGLFDLNGMKGIRRPLFESHIVHRFCSSLAEADIVLEKLCFEGGFEKLRFEYSDELTHCASNARLSIKDYLDADNDSFQDVKIAKLTEIIKTFDSEKIVIFCVYKQTADYIVHSIERLLPDVSVRSTVDKNADELESIIQSFAPVANSIDLNDDENTSDNAQNGDSIRVLVATTAMSEGFNFQDASVMVNFDLPWTVLVLAQRMGRIMRPWRTPRDIHIFNLIPSTMTNPDIAHALNWNRRLHQRNREFSSFADIPVMVEKSDEFEMVDLARSMGALGDIDLELDDVYRFIENADNLKTSNFLDDLALLGEGDARHFNSLPDGVKSFKKSTLAYNALYLLIRFKNGHYPVLFDEDADIIMGHERIDDIMNLVRSPASEEHAMDNFDLEELDRWYNRAISGWALKNGIEIDAFSVRCVMVLLGRGER